MMGPPFRELCWREVVSFVKLGCYEKGICVVEEGGTFPGCIDAEEEMIVCDKAIKVEICPKSVLGQRGDFSVLRGRN